MEPIYFEGGAFAQAMNEKEDILEVPSDMSADEVIEQNFDQELIEAPDISILEQEIMKVEKEKPILKQAQKSGLEVFSDNRTPQQPKVEKKEPI